MGRGIHMWRFGHFGMPLIVFPSASGMAHEWDAHGMVESLAPLIDRGKLKLYCVESNVAEAWTRTESDPAWRMQRHRDYEQFVLEDLVPFIRRDCRSESIRMASTGCSLGATYAANFSLKYPEVFHWALCLSGRYDLTEMSGGRQGLDFYFNNPMSFVPNLEGAALDRVRRETHLVLVCGQGPWENGNSDEMLIFARVLAQKGISHERDLWGHDVAHEWVWWRRQARFHLERAFGG